MGGMIRVYDIMREMSVHSMFHQATYTVRPKGDNKVPRNPSEMALSPFSRRSMVDQVTNGPLAAPGRNHTRNHAGLSLCDKQQSLPMRSPLPAGQMIPRLSSS